MVKVYTCINFVNSYAKSGNKVLTGSTNTETIATELFDCPKLQTEK